MRYEAEDIRVGKRLRQALASLRIRTCRKYVTLFFILISSLFFVNSTRAESALPPSGQDGKMITVQAVVPLTPEFAYSIKKNSSLASEKAAFALGEEVRIQVRIAGGNDEPLRGHTIRLQAVNARGENLIGISMETDSDGLAYFTFVADADFLGDDILRVVDVTYDVPILLHQELNFIVYETDEDGQEHREQATKIGISGNQPLSLGQSILVEAETHMATGISQNSGTIVTRDSKGALTRAGP